MKPGVIVVMGVAGAGKTTVGSALASALGWRFEDADRYHPPANVAKMSAGIPLTDEDRVEWLAALRPLLDRAIADGVGLVLACSALREAYRETLGLGRPEIAVVHLTAPVAVLSARLSARAGHFMPVTLLDSQLQTLEPPCSALTLDATRPVAELVRTTRAAFGL